MPRGIENELLNNRIILMYGYIDTKAASSIVRDLLTLSYIDDKKEIKLYIASFGGSYLDMMAIYDTIENLQVPVSGVCIGQANGYAALILASCTKGKRYALAHSTISIEQTMAILVPGPNQQTEIAIAAREAKNERLVFEKIIAEKTTQAFERIHDDCETGITLSAQEAIEYGLIDGIIV